MLNLNRMKNVILKLCRWALGILGFAAADACNEIFPPTVAEYGCPYAEYEIKGKVVDKDTGKPLQKIEVEAFSKYKDNNGETVLYPIYSAKDTTKADGLFNMSGSDMIFESDEILLKCRDLDDSDGKYGELGVDVPLTKKNTEHAGNWYLGKFQYDASEIKMTEKPEE